MESRADRIFYIGLHKTGTTTYASLCQAGGFKVLHGRGWHIPNDTRREQYTCFADLDGQDGLPDLNWMTVAYPKARFVLNTRPLISWVVSVLDHTTSKSKRCSGGKFFNSHTKQERQRLGTQDFIKQIVRQRLSYHQHVLSVFGTNASMSRRLLISDITSEPTTAVAQKLSAFFGLTKSQAKIVDDKASEYTVLSQVSGKNHVSAYHKQVGDPGFDFIEATLHAGNTAETMTALADILDPTDFQSQTQNGKQGGIQSCPGGYVAV